MHSPTLLVMLSILSAIMALTQTAVWYFNKRIPGLASWAGGYWVALFSSLNFLFRTPESELFWVLSLQIFQFLVAYLIYKGLRDYLGLEQERFGPKAMVLITLLAAMMYYTLWDQDPVLRIIASSLLISWLFLLSAYTLIANNQARSAARILVAIPCLFHGLFAIARIFIMLEHRDQVQVQFFDPTALPPIVLLETIAVLVVISFGTLILANEYITRELRRLAEKDALTGTCNRRTFLTLLGKALSIAQRRETALSVLLIDLDHFKKINDTWGHKQGDAALGHFVKVAESCLRNEDVLGRLGGEEFAIFLPNTGLIGARTLAERLRSRVEASVLNTEHGRINLTISIGVVQCAPGHESSEEILHRADSAMYLAKQEGRNRVQTDEFIMGTS